MLIPNWLTTNHRIQPIGLDLGHRSVKMVQLVAHEGRAKVLAARRAPVDLDRLGGAEREQSLLAAIRGLLADGQFRGRRVISALPVDCTCAAPWRPPMKSTVSPPLGIAACTPVGPISVTASPGAEFVGTGGWFHGYV